MILGCENFKNVLLRLEKENDSREEENSGGTVQVRLPP